MTPSQASPIALPPDEVHLWRADLDTTPDALERLRSFLTDAERDRTDRLLSPVAQRRTAASRAILRRILSGYLGEDPCRIPLAFGPHGKPRLDVSSPLRFNVSHTQNHFLCAVACDREVGVDVERVRPGRDVMKIAVRFFSRDETRALEALPPEERTDAFYRLWARKEAVIKGDGRGFALPPDSFTVSQDAPSTVVFLEGERVWRLVDIDAFEGSSASVGLEGEGAYGYRLSDFVLS